jgi:hypothetical protein
MDFSASAAKSVLGQTGRTIETRCKEHMRCMHLGQPEKSGVVMPCNLIGSYQHFRGTLITTYKIHGFTIQRAIIDCIYSC